jgi:hypothetical protein
MTTTDPEKNTAPLFASPAAFRDAFEQGLQVMLEEDQLGAFVLVLANASYEAAMFERMRPRLREVYERWRRRFDVGEEPAVNAPADDAAVFQRLCDIGFDALETTRWRDVGPWQVQFNPLRALRPPRMSKAVVTGLRKPFDADGFHFNKPFLRRECLWEGELCEQPLRLLYNKFPFADLHGLLVPQPAAARPQYLDAAIHALVWDIVGLLGERLPGIGFGYNAYGAYASVNHLHLQSFVRATGGYPIASSRWRHNGGGIAYPLTVRRFDDADAAWAFIESLHRAEQAYNLLYLPGLLFVTLRRMQGGYTHSDWTGGFAWSEIAGAITVFNESDFERLDEATIEAEFARMK